MEEKETKKLITICAIAALTSAVNVPSAFAVTISVPGEACIHFAGQTQPALEALYPPSTDWASVPWDIGNVNPYNLYNDTAPWEGVIRAYSDPAYSDITARTAASLIPPFIDVSGWESAGIKLSITATGNWGHNPAPAYHSGPDGYWWYETSEQYDDLGISRLYALINSLVGVFLSDEPPDPAAIPIRLTPGVDDMTTPALQQTFVIGSMLENITIPSGATRLFLGLHDADEWWNNDGDIDVTVIPEPATILLLGLGGLLFRRRRSEDRRQRK